MTPRRDPPPTETALEPLSLEKASSPKEDQPTVTAAVSEESLSSPVSPSLPPAASPPARSPRHPARGPSSPIRRSVTPTSHSDMHKRSASSMDEEVKQLRKVEEDDKRRNMPEPRTPKTVSNVKARVREIEEEAGGVIASPDSRGPASASPVRTPNRAQRPITPRRSAQRMRSTQSSTSLREMPSLAAAIVSGPPAALGKPVDVASNSPEPETLSTPEAAAASESKSHVSGDESSGTIETVAPVHDVFVSKAPPKAPADQRVASDMISTPAQESAHLSVKVPTVLDQLPSPLPTPTSVGVAVNGADDGLTGGPVTLGSSLTSESPARPAAHVVLGDEVETAVQAEAVSREQEPEADRAVTTESLEPLPLPATPPRTRHGGDRADVASHVIDTSAGALAVSTSRPGHADHAESALAECSDEGGTPEKRTAVAGQPDHLLHVSPSRQSLATTLSYRTADSGTPTPSEAGQLE